jgi:small subunit ribosomal protein S4e
MPREWPIPRKGTAYLAKASHSKDSGISILFILRDMLKLARTRKEARYILRNGNVTINNQIRKDENFPVQVFDSISMDKLKKHYRLDIVNGKFSLVEISAKETERKIVKISGKKIIDSKTIQMNLEDGQNFLSASKFSLGDSVVVNTKERKVEKILELKEGAKLEIVAGKYAGEEGKLKSIRSLKRGTDYIVKINDKEVELPLKTFLVIE